MVLGLPAALAVVLCGALETRRVPSQRPVLAFFFTSGLVALALFAGWGLDWGSFPQFSDVGLI